METHKPVCSDKDLIIYWEKQLDDLKCFFKNHEEFYIYDRSENRVISFFLPTELTRKERALITWSLHESNLNRAGTLFLQVNAIVSPNDKIKRYQVLKVSNQPIVE